jgi:signal transduction histidine kinase
MNILNWIYFITASIGYIISLVGSIININDEEEDYVILFNFTNYITIGLVFYTAISIFSSTVVLILFWSLLGISTILSLYTIYKFIWGSRVEIPYKIAAIIVLCLLIITVFISFKLNISSTIIDAKTNSDYKPILPIVEIILALWMPLTILLFIYWKIKTKSNQINTNEPLHYKDKEIEEVVHRLYYLYNEFSDKDMPMGYFLEEADRYMRRFDIPSEMRHRIFRNIERLSDRRIRKRSISEFRDMILYGFFDSYENDSHRYSFENNYLLENITERIQTIFKKEFSRINRTKDYDDNSINSINQNIGELKQLLSKQTTKNIDNTSLLQNFIKELFHSLMTPISQIEASLITIKAKFPQTDEVSERSIKSIKAGIELVKSNLSAYRQLVFYAYNDTNEDTITIKDGINSAELLYQSHNKKNIHFEYNDIPDSIQGYSNNFILAILLPLLENAIYATETGQQIGIEYESTEQNHIFKISNPINNPVNISNLYKNGFSSKNEKGKPHKGTGLTIVRNLIANIENSKLDFEVNNNIITVILIIHNNGI